MSKKASFPFKLEILKNNHKASRENFNCGISELDNYLKEKAGQDFKKNISTPFLLIDETSDKIAGYYTLSMFSIQLRGLSDGEQKKLPNYPDIPATLIGRLAVDLNYKGQGLGKYLLIDALKKSCENEIATYCVVVDAKDKNSIEFYKKHGFILFKGVNNRLYISMKTIKQLF